ncbi:MAG: hypothetical protein RBS38_01720 [Bacteroidales bacterium]|jgi:hypothetical protein|nr:hypothetical protein [Bacteroidales bacterium]
MKTLQKFILVSVLLTLSLFVSGQTKPDIKQLLSDADARKEIMDFIANDSIMSKEMMETMMNNKNCMMMMQGNEKMKMMRMENHGAMMKMMKDNPGMMKSMMSDMMEVCKSDTSMMSLMRRTMMDDQHKQDMKQRKMGGNIEKKNVNGMNKLK